MSNTTSINENITTRIIPGVTSEHQIISLPYWAWFWLEDFMIQNKICFKGIYETFESTGDLNQTLHNLAELHQEYSMREIYNLSNDNDIEDNEFAIRLRSATEEKPKTITELNLPKIYKLFGFMSCATTLESVWRRKNYESSNKAY